MPGGQEKQFHILLCWQREQEVYEGRRETKPLSLWRGGGRRVRVICGSCERLVLTRNCSRCLSDSGVNSADMGMTSPARIMIALREEGTDKTKVFTSAAPAGLQAA